MRGATSNEIPGNMSNGKEQSERKEEHREAKIGKEMRA
jgi:hypothetical protein